MKEYRNVRKSENLKRNDIYIEVKLLIIIFRSDERNGNFVFKLLDKMIE